VGIGVRNLFNTRYRDYLNSMRYFTDEMGRNISFRLKISIEKNQRDKSISKH
jgi:iron complex outermembrane receptor protein